MSAEDRLRTALHAAVDDTHVPPESFDRIERRTASARRRRRAAGGGLAMVAVVALAVGVPVALQDDGEPVRTGPARETRDTTTTTSTRSTTTEPAPSQHVVDEPLFRWPSDGTRYESPGDLVSAFAEEYLGVVRPAVDDDGNSTFTVRPRGEGGQPVPADGPRTVVRVADVGGRPAVVEATSPNLDVDAPAAGGMISSAVAVTGRGRGLYEGTVLVEVRDQTGAVLATVHTTAAGSGPDEAPFGVEARFPAASGRGALVVMSTSGLEGTPEATVVPVAFGPPTEQPTTEVTVFLLDERQDVVPVTRQVPRTTGVLRAALLELLEGATPEEDARGLSSPFDDLVDALRGVTITEDGTAIVDLEPAVVEALAGADGAAVLASLDHTVFQFPSVTWVTYRVNGGCADVAGIGTDLLCERRSRDQY